MASAADRRRCRLALLVLAGGLALLCPPGFAAEPERRTPVVVAVEKAVPAVVNIRTEQIVQRRSSPLFGFGEAFFDEFFREFGPQRTYRTQSLGSGVIIDPRGYVLTNAHVVEKASHIYVALPGERGESEASLVGTDPRIDLAVLRLSGRESYPFLPAGQSGDLLLGESVIAIGNPLGLGHTITTGVVSTSARRVALEGGGVALFIQSDALMNPGNSGGALVNLRGELVGINTAIARQAQGIGFSIPIDVAKRVLADLIEHGRVRPVYTGIFPGEVGRAFARAHGGGVLVAEIDEASPAARAGLRVADVILSLDRVAVTDAAEFRSLLATYAPGDGVTLELLRGTEELSLRLRLAAVPAGYASLYLRRHFGFAAAPGRSGLSVTEVLPGSPAERVGLRPGDLIRELEGVPLKDGEMFEQLLGERLGQVPLRFLVARGNRSYLISLPY